VVRRLTQTALEGDFLAAREAHRALYPLAKALLSLDTNPIPIKTALAIKGRCAEEFRLPLCGLSPENRRKLAALLESQILE
jgi:4-hydroxy-tetrahydrodipicolinate synthase